MCIYLCVFTSKQTVERNVTFAASKKYRTRGRPCVCEREKEKVKERKLRKKKLSLKAFALK